MTKAFRLALPLLAFFLVAFSKKLPPTTVRFYEEADPQTTENFQMPVQLQFPPRQTYIQKVPVISERDVETIYLFPAADGTMGCAFKLDLNGTAKLDRVSVERRGTSLVAVVNGRQITDMLIDRRVSDGILSIPGGLTGDDVQRLTKAFRTMKPRTTPLERRPAHFGDG